jgi:hypothetical protein
LKKKTGKEVGTGETEEEEKRSKKRKKRRDEVERKENEGV